MKVKLWLAIRPVLVAHLLFSFAVLSMAQNTRPRYSQPPANQQNDVISEDTIISLRTNDTLSSKSSRVGDRFTASVTVPVYVGGKIAIPAGAVVTGRVTQVTPAKRMAKSGVLAIDFEEIELPNGLTTKIIGTLTSDDPMVREQIDDENRVSGGKNKDAAVFIGGSGVLGAILGGITGGGKGAAVGGAVGAGVGAASVLFSKGEEATVPAGTNIGLRLKQALPVPDDTITAASDPGNTSSTTADPSTPNRDTSADVRARSSNPPPVNEENSTSSSRPPVLQPSTKAEENEAASTATTPAEPTAGDNEPVDESLPLSSPEMIRRAQSALNQEGYYEGELDGDLNPRTVSALKTYQREHKLPETGRLDEATAKSLGIVGTRSAQRKTPASTPNTTPTRNPGDVSVDQPVRSTPPAPSSTGATRQPTAGTQRESIPTSSSTTTAPNVARLQERAEDLLSDYHRMIGVRMTGNGLEFDSRTAYTDDDISLLFALDSFVNSTQLYGRILPGLQTQQALRSATLSLAKEARKTDKIITTSASRWANNLNPKWDIIRQQVLKLMYTYNINTTELDT